MEIGDTLVLSYFLTVINKMEITVNGDIYTVLLLDNCKKLYLKRNFVIQNQINIAGHEIKSEQEINGDDYYYLGGI